MPRAACVVRVIATAGSVTWLLALAVALGMLGSLARAVSADTADAGTGVGLRNVRERLTARFGDLATCRWGPRPAGGFAVTLTLPLVYDGC